MRLSHKIWIWISNVQNLCPGPVLLLLTQKSATQPRGTSTSQNRQGSHFYFSKGSIKFYHPFAKRPGSKAQHGIVLNQHIPLAFLAGSFWQALLTLVGSGHIAERLQQLFFIIYLITNFSPGRFVVT